MPFENRVSKDLLRVIDYPHLSRLGRPNDGGYVVPVDAIRMSTHLLSFGISSDWKFEQDVQQLNPEILIHAYDHSVEPNTFRRIITHAWITILLRALCLNFKGTKTNLGRWLNAIDYFRFFQGNVCHIRKRVWYNNDKESADISEIIQKTGCAMNNKIFAKIDIEGSEYRILPSVIDEADKFSGLVIEFHNIDICAAIFNELMTSLTTHFYIVHIHGNNRGDLSVNHELPNTIEISFVHKNLVPGAPKTFKGSLPRKEFDAPNDPSLRDYEIDLFSNENQAQGGKPVPVKTKTFHLTKENIL